ncbi:hypothetical protein IJ768_03505 [Candidatus Saccharibacteria bacterium]|nr:hypothetical protein [Candidatus Saccharibacteria bacterium]
MAIAKDLYKLLNEAKKARNRAEYMFGIYRMQIEKMHREDYLVPDEAYMPGETASYFKQFEKVEESEPVGLKERNEFRNMLTFFDGKFREVEKQCDDKIALIKDTWEQQYLERENSRLAAQAETNEYRFK